MLELRAGRQLLVCAACVLALGAAGTAGADAKPVLLADFEEWTAETLAARCPVEGGDNIRVELVKTDERMGKQSLRLVARVERAKPIWSCAVLRAERPAARPTQLTFWYRAERESPLYLTIEDSRGQRVDHTLPRDLEPNRWHPITVDLVDAHVPNGEPPNDRATPADVAAVRFHPHGKLYSADGEVAFQIDDVRVLTASGGAERILEPVLNGGFEEGEAAGPDGWSFGISREAKASMATDAAVKHEGARSLRLRNESGLAPHVYGRLTQSMPVLAGTAYRLSAWVRGEKVASGNHFTDWKSYHVGVPAGSYDWRRIEHEFQTKPDQTTLEIGLNVVNRAEALWVDDIRLEPIAEPLKSTLAGLSGLLFAPLLIEGDNREIPVRLYLRAPEGFRGKAAVTIAAGKATRHGPTKEVAAAGTLDLPATSGEEPAETLEVRVAVLDASGKEVATATSRLSKTSEKVVRGILAEGRAGLEKLREAMAAAQREGIPLDYPRVTATVAESFLPWLEEDAAKGELQRASWGAKEVRDSLARALAEIAAYRKDRRGVPAAVRYQTGKLEIRGGSFIGDTVDARGRRGRGPVFFTGYGHFGSVRRDIEKFPAYGVNIVQIEFGPNSVLPSEDGVSTAAVEEVQKVLDRAAQAHVMVNLLLSPHYFPDWALAEWPQLKSCGGGFLRYCVDAPESRRVIEKSLRVVVPRLRGKPALHSFCLSNEPIWTPSPECPHTRQGWADYLRRAYGSAERLNARLGLQVKDLAEAPIPDQQAFDHPLFYDYCVFNQRRFADWHGWMAGIIHEMAPEIPAHAKVMMNWMDRHTVAWGTDPECFASVSEINGNDCAIFYPGSTEWAQGWQGQALYYDLQRSMKAAPIFNSENHVMVDRSTHYYPPEHVRTALWQGAIHGQGATTLWVWERTYDRKSDFYGNIMHRPGSAEALGRTNLDLNRFAPEVTALQNAPAPAALLYSVASIARDPAYLDALKRVHAALAFTGVRVALVSEPQVAGGKLKEFRWLIVPQAGSVQAETLEAIGVFARAGGRVAAMGESPLAKDEIGKPHPENAVRAALAGAGAPPPPPNIGGAWGGSLRLDETSDLERLRDQLLAALGKDAPAQRPIDAATGKTAWGVEWRVARVGSRTVANLVNLTPQPKRIRLEASGKPIAARDLLTGQPLAREFDLPPLTPVLAAW